MPQMAATFREWLEATLTETGASKRGVARRMAERHPNGVTQDTIESSRTTLRKILVGKHSPTQPTRDSIQEALGKFDAPTVEDEAADAPTAAEALALLRELRRATRLLERAIPAGAR